MIQLDGGSWAGQPAVAEALIHVSRHAIRTWLNANGWFGVVRVHCWAKMSRPVNTGQSGYQAAVRLVCQVKQYVTGGD